MTYRHGKHVAWRELGSETVLIHLRNKKVFGLNASGGYVWKALADEGRSERLSALLGAPAETVSGFLVELEHEGLLDRCEESQPQETSPAAFAGSRENPSIAWRDEVTAFLGACAKFPGGGLCDQLPELS